MGRLIPQSPAARLRLFILLSILVVVPLGFASKFYRGPGQFWANNSLGGLLYVVFWCLVVQLLVPKAKPVVAVTSVLVITSVLEAFQLWHPPVLQAIRGTFLGATLIGTTFVWSDFFYYVLGSLLGWAWLRALGRFAGQFAARL